MIAPQDAGTFRIIDLYPTLCGLADVPAPDDLDGTDLSRSVEQETESERGPVFMDHLSNGDTFSFRMIWEDRYKYVGFRNAPELLFNLDNDPHETTNLAPDATGEDAEELARLRDQYESTIDWNGIDRERREFKDRTEASLPIPPETGNAYLLLDDRLVDAATAVYKSDELAAEPSRVFDGYPDDE